MAWAAAEKQFPDTQIWWRGHASASWKLEPHVYRIDNGKHEKTFALQFRTYAQAREPESCPPNDNLDEWLFLMQHHGLPTRLLDWSRSFLVASYFATMTEPKTETAALWALSPGKLNKDQWNDESLFQPKQRNALPLFLQAIDPGQAAPDKVMAVIYPETHKRMLIQQAAATLHGSKVPIDQLPNCDQFLMKFEIDKATRPQIAHALEAFGIRKSYLFPDLDHLAEEIKEPRHVAQFPRP